MIYHHQSPTGRITPARAGKTDALGQALRRNGDHPRSCGKDAYISRVKPQQGGSPPLVRERLISVANAASKAGITPARAGKTLSCTLSLSRFRDHPRSCGKDIN